MKALSIDLGGSHATLAVIEDQTILASREIAVDSAAGLAPILGTLTRIMRELLGSTGIRAQDCDGMAISICAMVQNDRVVATNGKFEDAPEIDLVEWCRAEFGLPFAMDNDARMALLGEWYAGAAQGANDVVMMTLGTGVGAAALIGGRPLRTSQVQGGCLGGHIPVLFTGRRCTCGGFGCMEAEASGWALPLISAEWPGFAESALAGERAINFRAVFELARKGDRVATEIRDRCLHVWASGAVGLIHAYGPERVVIGGGVMRSKEIILPYIRHYVANYSWTPTGPVTVLAAALGNDAGILGAIPLLGRHAAPTAPIVQFPGRTF